MKAEWVTAFTVAVTLAGFVWHAAQMAERQRALRVEFEKFEVRVLAELEKLNDRLATGAGGRRRYTRSATASDTGRAGM